MKMTRKNSVQWFTGHRLQRLDFAGRTVKVSMHTAIRFPAHVDKVHRLVNLLAAADDDILKALEPSCQIPLDKVVQALTHQGVVLVRVKAAVVTGDTYKGDSNKVFAQLCDELRNQLGHTLDLLNDVLLVGHSDRLMDIAGNLISVCPDDAILAGMHLSRYRHIISRQMSELYVFQ